jgi:ketosteroid isomerase-like protein
MSRNKALVQEMIERFDTMDAYGFRPLLHDQAKHSAPGSDFGADLQGAEAIAEYFRNNVFPSFHAVRFEVVNLFEDAEQRTVIVEWRSHLQPKSGKNYTNNGVFVIEVKDEKIYWVREYFDTEKSHQHM